VVSVESTIQFEDYKFQVSAGDDLSTAEKLLREIEEEIETHLRSHSSALS
jgi:hypothetical protein